MKEKKEMEGMEGMEEKLKESKTEYIKDLCINEYDVFGNPLQHGSNLIMIKIGNNKFVCLTPFEVQKILEKIRSIPNSWSSNLCRW